MSHDYPFPIADGQLLVAAVHGIYAWSSKGLVELFTSGSKGIVAATQTKDHEDILAVADSHVVVLHSIKEGMQRTYRLKESGPPRKLWYDRNNDRLLYTTALETAVQVYSLKSQRLVEPATSHPSPPTTFAVHSSKHLNVMLSASAKPPITYITTLDGDQSRSRCLVQPPSSASACSAAAFHPAVGPGPETILFLLGFLDGTVAAYSYSSSDAYEELASLPKAHIGTTEEHPRDSHLRSVMPSATVVANTTEDTGNPRIGDSSTAVVEVALMPGRLCLGVSIGSDGWCCVIDFEPDEGPRMERRWALHSSASALTVRKDLIAVGLKTGKVLLYSVNGELLHFQTFGEKIVDLEWIQRSVKAVHQQSKNPLPLENPSTQAKADSQRTKTSSRVIEATPKKHLRKNPKVNTAREPLPPHSRMSKTKTDTSKAFVDGGSRIAKPSPTNTSNKMSGQCDFQEDQISDSSNCTIRYLPHKSRSSKDCAQSKTIPSSSSLPLSPKVARRKPEKQLSSKTPPSIPPRPVKSPEKTTIEVSRQISGGRKKGRNQGKSRHQAANANRGSDGSAESVTPSPLTLDGNKDKPARKTKFLDRLPKNSKVPPSRMSSASSSAYSEDYILEWPHSGTVQDRDRQLAESRLRLPFRPPTDALVQQTHPTQSKEQFGIQQPVLKAPFPSNRRQSLPTENLTLRPAPLRLSVASGNRGRDISIRDIPDLEKRRPPPATPRLALAPGTVSSPTRSPPLPPTTSASKEHSEAKKARKSSSQSREVRSPTPTRQRQEQSVELCLVDDGVRARKPGRSPPRPPLSLDKTPVKADVAHGSMTTSTTSSVVASSYSTACSQQANRSKDTWLTKFQDKINLEQERFRIKMQTLCDEHEQRLHSIVKSFKDDSVQDGSYLVEPRN